MNPAARPLSGGNIEQVARLLTRSHLGCLALYIVSLVLRLPDCLPAMTLLFLGAVAAESLPRRLHRRALPELLVLIASLLALSQVPHEGQALGLLLRGFMASWILIPSRLGMLRLLPLLLIADAVLSPTLSLPFVLLPPLAAAALLVDCWLRVLMQDLPGVICNHHPPVSPWRWLLGLLPACWLLALLFGAQLHEQLRHVGPHHTPRIGLPPGSGEEAAADLATVMRIGDHRWVSQSPTVMARVVYERPTMPPVLYLRALTVPDIGLQGSQITWSSQPTAPHPLPERPQWYEADDDSQVRVVRMRGSSDVVLRPDGAAWLDLADCLADDDGNCYQAGIGLTSAAYTSHAGAGSHPNSSTRLNVYRRLPNDLQGELRRRFPQIEQWRMMSAIDAGRRIVALLRRRCHYATEGLPPPPEGRAASLLQFIDGPEDRRVGHCQYFASACTVLLRAAGHAARPVIGFASDEVEGTSVIFRALHAHAWIELLDDQQTWHRLDPTPPSALALDGELLADWRQEQAGQEDYLIDLDRPHRWPWRRWVLVLGAVAFALVIMYLRKRHRGKEGDDPHQRRLRQQRQALLTLAIAFGIEVRHSSSMTRIVAELEARSGVTLQPVLGRYLAARFAGRGEIPAWPMSELRAALQRRRGTARQAAVAAG